MVMSVIMFDSVAMLGSRAQYAYQNCVLFDIFFADDTLLLGTEACHVGEFAAVVERVGATYGMQLHWDKTRPWQCALTNKSKAPMAQP